MYYLDIFGLKISFHYKTTVRHGPCRIQLWNQVHGYCGVRAGGAAEPVVQSVQLSGSASATTLGIHHDSFLLAEVPAWLGLKAVIVVFHIMHNQLWHNNHALTTVQQK